jgi:hypothetical protein
MRLTARRQDEVKSTKLFDYSRRVAIPQPASVESKGTRAI